MKKNTLVKFLLIPVFYFSIICQLHAQPGTLDKTFGNDGRVATIVPGNGIAQLYKTAIQKDNKIVVAGIFQKASGIDKPLIVLRYLEDGVIDSSFGINGYTIIENGPILWSCCVAIQDDGKIVVGGRGFFIAEIILYRFLPNGNLDTSFGSDGLVIASLGGDARVHAIALLPNGKILAGGSFFAFDDPTFSDAPYAARFNEDGSLDVSFGKEGKCIVDSGGNAQCDITSMAVARDGRIILAGNNAQGISYGTLIFVAAVTSEGRTDSSFSDNGYTYTDISNNGETAEDVVVLDDGKIIAAGASYIFQFNGAKQHIALVQYNRDGSLDEGFGNKGTVETLVNEESYGYSMQLQQNGKIVVGGKSLQSNGTNDFVVARFLADGSLDSAFGTNGFAVTDMGDNDIGKSISLQNDGKIILGGTPNILMPGKPGILMARYIGDPVRISLITRLKRWIRNHCLHFTDEQANTAAYYVIERSTNNSTGFTEIARINKSEISNSLTESGGKSETYSYLLPQTSNEQKTRNPASVGAGEKPETPPLSGQARNFYHIKAVDNDGSIAYSDIISETDNNVSAFNIYPNPVKEVLHISGLNASLQGVLRTNKTSLTILNMQGNVIKKASVQASSCDFNVGSLKQGTYYLRVEQKNNCQTYQFVKQ